MVVDNITRYRWELYSLLDFTNESISIVSYDSVIHNSFLCLMFIHEANMRLHTKGSKGIQLIGDFFADTIIRVETMEYEK